MRSQKLLPINFHFLPFFSLVHFSKFFELEIFDLCSSNYYTNNITLTRFLFEIVQTKVSGNISKVKPFWKFNFFRQNQNSILSKNDILIFINKQCYPGRNRRSIMPRALLSLAFTAFFQS